MVEHLTFNQVVRGSNPRCLIPKKNDVVRKNGVFSLCNRKFRSNYTKNALQGSINLEYARKDVPLGKINGKGMQKLMKEIEILRAYKGKKYDRHVFLTVR